MKIFMNNQFLPIPILTWILNSPGLGSLISKVGVEGQIDLNGPPLHMVDKLGEKALVKFLEEDQGGIL